MEKFTIYKGTSVPVMNDNIDTDQIIPKQFLKAIDKKGFGKNLFYEWRYLKDYDENPDFILNAPKYKKASLLISGDNFGSGSSREHAPLCLKTAGVSCVIAETFARIFYRNAINIGLPIIECPEAAKAIEAGDEVEIDFDSGKIYDRTKGTEFQGQPFPEFMQKLIAAGGLVKYTNSKRK